MECYKIMCCMTINIDIYECNYFKVCVLIVMFVPLDGG